MPVRDFINHLVSITEKGHLLQHKWIALLSPIFGFVAVRLRKQIKLWTAYILDAFILYPLGRWIKHAVSARATLRRYCQLLQGDERMQYLYVPGRQELKVKVEDIFVPLQLESRGVAQTVYTHADLLLLGNRIRIIGDPGSGKSSLIKRIFLDCCTTGIRKPTQSRLPCLVNLSSLSIPIGTSSKSLGEWMYGELVTRVAKTNVFRMTECFDTYARTQGLLVLLDGLDEVSRNQYERVQLAIEQLGSKLALMSDKNATVLTMRAQFFQEIQDRTRETPGHALFIKPFSPSDIYEFLRKWPFAGDSLQLRNRIYGDLSDRPTLREMCTNPLVLSMFVGEYQVTSEVITPESRTEFYSRVTDELLIKRRLTQTGRPPAPAKLREQREKILGQLAYDHLIDETQPSNSLQVKSLKRIICDVTKCDDTKAESAYRDLAKETGLISEERSGETIRFIHLTFCEFLAAREAIQEREMGFEKLCAAHDQFQRETNPQTRSRLVEVIPFASGLLVRKDRSQALASISAFGDYRLSARCFLETKAYEDRSWPIFVQRAKEYFISPSLDGLDDSWLRDLHLFTVVILDAEEALGHLQGTDFGADLDQFYEMVLTSQSDKMEALIAAYAQQDAAAAFRLADASGIDLPTQFPQIVIASCDQRPFLDRVVERIVTTESSERGLWAVLLAEAALRSSAVAEELNARVLDPRLPAVDSLVLHGSTGIMLRVLGKTLYAQLMGLALGSELIPDALALQLAKSIRFKFGSWVSWAYVQGTLLAFYMALVFFVANNVHIWGIARPSKLFHTSNHAVVYIALILAYGSTYLLARGLVLNVAIKMFFNLDSNRALDRGGAPLWIRRNIWRYSRLFLFESERNLLWSLRFR